MAHDDEVDRGVASPGDALDDGPRVVPAGTPRPVDRDLEATEQRTDERGRHRSDDPADDDRSTAAPWQLPPTTDPVDVSVAPPVRKSLFDDLDEPVLPEGGWFRRRGAESGHRPHPEPALHVEDQDDLDLEPDPEPVDPVPPAAPAPAPLRPPDPRTAVIAPGLVPPTPTRVDPVADVLAADSAHDVVPARRPAPAPVERPAETSSVTDGPSHATPTAGAPGRSGRLGTALVAVLLALVALGGAAGVALTWPSTADPSGGRGDLARGTVTAVTSQACPPGLPTATGASGECAAVQVRTDDGVSLAAVAASDADLATGDAVVVRSVDGPTGAEQLVVDADRRLPLAVVGGAVLLLAVLAARWRGLRAVIASALAVAAIGGYVLPALRTGEDPLAVAASATAVLVVVLGLLVHGVGRRGSAAVVSTAVGLAITAGLGLACARLLHLPARDLTTAATLVAGLGVLLDLTSRQTEASTRIRQEHPDETSRQRLARSLTVAGELFSSSLLMVVLVFTGAGLLAVLAEAATSPDATTVLTGSVVVTELVRASVCGLAGLVALPVAAWVGGRGPGAARSDDDEIGPRRR